MKDIKRIWFDMDDVLCQFFRSFGEHVWWEIEWVKFKYEDIKLYHVWELSRVKLDKQWMTNLFKRYFEEWDWLSIAPWKWVIDKVNELHNRWKELYIITSRYDETQKITIQRANKHFGDKFKDIHFTSFIATNYIPKSQIAQKLGLDMFVDDNPAYCEDIAKNCNIPVYFHTQPWNKE